MAGAEARQLPGPSEMAPELDGLRRGPGRSPTPREPRRQSRDTQLMSRVPAPKDVGSDGQLLGRPLPKHAGTYRQAHSWKYLKVIKQTKKLLNKIGFLSARFDATPI